MKFVRFLLTAVVLGGALAAYGVSVVWPAYEWHLRVPSPDGRYELIVLRGNATAFDDFSYRIYVFPHSSAPHDRAKATRVWFTHPWRGNEFLVYSGYNYPMFRWVNSHSIEININDVQPQPFQFEAVKRFGNPSASEAVLVSVVFNQKSSANVLP